MALPQQPPVSSSDCISYTLNPQAFNPSTYQPFQAQFDDLANKLRIPMKELLITLPQVTDLVGEPAGCTHHPDLTIGYEIQCFPHTVEPFGTNQQIRFPQHLVYPAGCSHTDKISFYYEFPDPDPTQFIPVKEPYYELMGGSFYLDACSETSFSADLASVDFTFEFTTGYTGLLEPISFAHIPMSWTRGTDVWSTLEEVNQICGGLQADVSFCASGINPTNFNYNQQNIPGQLRVRQDDIPSISAGSYQCTFSILNQGVLATQKQITVNSVSSTDCYSFKYLGATAVQPDPLNQKDHHLIEFSYEGISDSFEVQVDFLGCTSTSLTVVAKDSQSGSFNGVRITESSPTHLTFMEQSVIINPLNQRIQTFHFQVDLLNPVAYTNLPEEYYETAVQVIEWRDYYNANGLGEDPRVNIFFKRVVCVHTVPLLDIVTFDSPTVDNTLYTYVRPYLLETLNPGKVPSAITLQDVQLTRHNTATNCGFWDDSVQTIASFTTTQIGSAPQIAMWPDPYDFIDKVYPARGEHPLCTAALNMDPCQATIYFIYTLFNTYQNPLQPIQKDIMIKDGFKELTLQQYTHNLNKTAYNYDLEAIPSIIVLTCPLFQENQTISDNFQGLNLGDSLLERRVFLKAQDPNKQSSISVIETSASLKLVQLQITPLLDQFDDAIFEVCYSYGPQGVYPNLENLCDTANPITFVKCGFSTLTPQALSPVEIVFFESGQEFIPIDLTFITNHVCLSKIFVVLNGGILDNFISLTGNDLLILDPIPETLANQPVNIAIQIEVNSVLYDAVTLELTVTKEIIPQTPSSPTSPPIVPTQPQTQETQEGAENVQIQLMPLFVEGELNYLFQLNGGVKEFDLYFEQQFLEGIQQSQKVIRELTIQMNLYPQLPHVVSFTQTLESALTKVTVSVDTILAAVFLQTEPDQEQNLEIQATFLVSDGITDPQSLLRQTIIINFYDGQTEEQSNELLEESWKSENKSKIDQQQDEVKEQVLSPIDKEIAKKVWIEMNQALSFKEWDPRQEDGQQIIPKVKSVDEMGIILIEFYPPILDVADDWTKAWDDTYLDLLSQDQRKQLEAGRERILEVNYIKRNQDFEMTTKMPFIIKTNLKLMSSQTVQLKIDFENPLFVSEGTSPDIVKIHLNKGFFRKRVGANPQNRSLQSVEKDSVVNSESHFVLLSEIPKQVESDSQAKLQIEIADQITSGIQTQFVLSFIASFFMKGALGFLWDLYNFMQVLAAITLFKALVPANMRIVTDIFTKVSNFQFFDKEKLYVSIFGEEDFNEESAEKTAKNQEKRGSGSTLKDILLYVLVFVVLVVIIVFLVVLRISILNKCCHCFKFVYLKIEHKIIFNSLLRSILTTYLSLSISTWFNVSKIGTNFSFKEDTFTTFMALASIGAPFAVYFFLKRSKDNLRKQEHRNRFGSLTQNLNLYRERACQLWPTAFLGRRFFLALLIVFGAFERNSPQFQVQVGLLLSYSMALLAVETLPMQSKTSNFVMILNEFFCGLLLVSMLCFTNFVLDPEIQSQIGEKVLIILAVAVILNIGSTVYIQFVLLKNVIRQKFMKKNAEDKKSQKSKDEQLKNFLKLKIKQSSQKKMSVIVEEISEYDEQEIEPRKLINDTKNLTLKKSFEMTQSVSDVQLASQAFAKELRDRGIKARKLLASSENCDNNKKLIQLNCQFDSKLDVTNEICAENGPNFRPQLACAREQMLIQARIEELRTEEKGYTTENLIDLKNYQDYFEPPEDIYAKFFEKDPTFLTKPLTFEELENELQNTKKFREIRQRDQIRPEQTSQEKYHIKDEISVEDPNQIKILEIQNGQQDIEKRLPRRKNLKLLI